MPPAPESRTCEDSPTPSEEQQQRQHHVVIVGAGMAGLTCARELLQLADHYRMHLQITMVEAQDRIGGRVHALTDPVTGVVLNVGAETVHGRDTLLTQWIDDYRQRHWIPQGLCNQDDDDFWQPIFVVSHADGGGRPSDQPTKDGYYGMYYIRNQLVPYDHPDVEALGDVLEDVLEPPPERIVAKNASLHDAILQRAPDLDPTLYALAVAGYGNTAGCSDLTKLSWSTLMDFESHWEENEVAGDFAMTEAVGGMHAVVQACWQDLQQDARVQLRLNWPVQEVIQSNSASSSHDEGGVALTSQSDETIQADMAVLAVPPPSWRKIRMDLPTSKWEALDKVGFERACKVILILSERLWEPKVQNLIAVDVPVPEIWFRSVQTETKGEVYVVTGYLVSGAADNLVKQLVDEADREQGAARILQEQLARIFGVDLNRVQEVTLSSAFFDWKDQPYIGGGYMYPQTGMTMDDLRELAAPVGQSLYFAGEATNTSACCTVQAAMETGSRAAREIWQTLLSRSTTKTDHSKPADLPAPTLPILQHS